MLPLLITLTASASSLIATIEVGPQGPEVIATRHSAQHVQPRSAGDIAIQTAEGDTLGWATLPDPRIRTVILPDGGGATARLERARIEVALPWPAGAERVVLGGNSHTPAPTSVPTSTALQAVQLQDSGPQEERLDLVLLGDGYTQAQLPDFHADVDWIVAYVLQRQPYSDYPHLFNIWRVDVTSTETGVSHTELEPDLIRDTALGCYYGCADIDRLVCCDDDAVLNTVAATVPDAEGVLVLINDPAYGGAGGFTYATAYVGEEDGREVAAHELGHSLVGLWDEYGYGIDGDGSGPNCSDSEAHSWDSWVGTDGVGAFQECSYTGHFRPTENGCMMRSLRDEYCPVCRQEAVLAMYARLPALITTVDPPVGTPLDEELDATAVAVTLMADNLDVEWTVNGGAPNLGVNHRILPRAQG